MQVSENSVQDDSTHKYDEIFTREFTVCFCATTRVLFICVARCTDFETFCETHFLCGILTSRQNFHQQTIFSDDIIRVESKHFMGDPISFLIVKEPANGAIESSTHPGVPILRFTQQQLRVGNLAFSCFDSDSFV